mmetsp:Transcript_67300/g.179484  ORF Transcript_67300/g.179484 Transcript_67300/m.179484 type:complete len:782 (+) Transcript_67300:40-2385(+)
MPSSEGSRSTSHISHAGGTEQDCNKMLEAAVQRVSTHNARRDSVMERNEEILRVRRMLRHRWVLDPVASPKLAQLDVWTALCVIFAMLVTPYEVAFVSDAPTWSFLGVANLVVDATFLVDMALQFFVAYEATDKLRGRYWVRKHSRIVVHYLQGWFWVDLVAIFPYELVAALVPQAGDASGKLRLVRTIRTLRLFKVARILKMNRLVQRYQFRISVRFAALELARMVLSIVVAAHWMACIWGLVANLNAEGATQTWHDIIGGPERFAGSPQKQYLLALYWAVTTLTAVGYGDITPQNMTEYVVCVFCMVLGGALWGWFIGSSCGLANRVMKHGIDYRQLMDDINYMIRDSSLPKALVQKLRFFMVTSTKHAMVTQDFQGIIDRMSMQLQGDVAAVRAMHLSQKVWYLRSFQTGVGTVLEAPETALVCSVAAAFRPTIAGPREPVNLDFQLSMLQSGLLSVRGRLVRRGEVLGVDCVVRPPDLVENPVVTSLAISQLYSIPREALLDILRVPPSSGFRFRYVQLLLTVHAVVRLVRDACRQSEQDKERELRRLRDLAHKPVVFKEEGQQDLRAIARTQISSEVIHRHRSMLGAINQQCFEVSDAVKQVRDAQQLLVDHAVSLVVDEELHRSRVSQLFPGKRLSMMVQATFDDDSPKRSWSRTWSRRRTPRRTGMRAVTSLFRSKSRSLSPKMTRKRSSASPDASPKRVPTTVLRLETESDMGSDVSEAVEVGPRRMAPAAMPIGPTGKPARDAGALVPVVVADPEKTGEGQASPRVPVAFHV